MERGDGNKVYYIRNGKLLVKIITKIGSKRYFFDSKAKVNMTKGWKTASNGRCYVKNGKLVTAPTRIKGTKTVTKYYNRKTGKWQTKKISGAKTKRVKVTTNYLYMFRKDGHLKTTKKLFKYNGKEYYGLGGGRLHTGWRAIVQKKKGYAVYFYKSSGAMAKNTKIKHLKIPKNGRLGRAYYLGIKRLDKTGWSLKSAFWWHQGLHQGIRQLLLHGCHVLCNGEAARIRRTPGRRQSRSSSLLDSHKTGRKRVGI